MAKRSKIINKLDKMTFSKLESWFNDLQTALPDLPINQSKRNKNLRKEILHRLLGETLTDDERAQLLGLPEGCRIREGAKIISPENLSIGEYCWIGENAILDATGGLEIGSHSTIGLSVFVWSHSNHLANLKMDNQIGGKFMQKKRTRIGSGCFLAGPSVVMPGVSIGDKVIIRPFSTVDTDIPSRSIVDKSGIKRNVISEAKIERWIRINWNSN